MTDNGACLGCDAGEIECVETGGCCASCDHRPELDEPGPDDVALPGLEHDSDPRWTKTQTGYLAHLAQLDYGDGWTFWSVCTALPAFDKHRGRYSADELEAVFLVRAGRARRALIVVQTGEVLAHTEDAGRPA